MGEVHVCLAACCDLQAVEHIAEILPKTVLNERTGFQLQRTEVTDSTIQPAALWFVIPGVDIRLFCQLFNGKKPSGDLIELPVKTGAFSSAKKALFAHVARGILTDAVSMMPEHFGLRFRQFPALRAVPASA